MNYSTNKVRHITHNITGINSTAVSNNQSCPSQWHVTVQPLTNATDDVFIKLEPRKGLELMLWNKSMDDAKTTLSGSAFHILDVGRGRGEVHKYTLNHNTLSPVVCSGVFYRSNTHLLLLFLC